MLAAEGQLWDTPGQDAAPGQGGCLEQDRRGDRDQQIPGGRSEMHPGRAPRVGRAGLGWASLGRGRWEKEVGWPGRQGVERREDAMEKSGIRVGCYEIWSWGGGRRRHAAPGWEWGQVWEGR